MANMPVFLILVLLLILPSLTIWGGEQRSDHQPHSEERFDQVFELRTRYVISAPEVDRGVSVYKPVIADETLFFSDFGGNRAYAVPIDDDEIIVSIGAPHALSVNAQSPYGLGISKHNRIFINERVTSRIKTITRDGNLVFDISHRGTADEIHLIRDEPGHTVLYLVGPAACTVHTVCSSRRIEILNDEVVSNQAFDEYDENPSVMTWTGSVEYRTGNMFVANVGSSNVAIFDAGLERVSTIELAVPDSVALRSGHGVGVTRRPYAYAGPRMYRMVIAEDNLYVQWIASPPEADSYRFVLSVYDLQGNVVVAGVSTDLQLASASESSVVFWSVGSVQAGSVRVYTYDLR